MSDWVSDYFSDVDAQRPEVCLGHSEGAVVVFGHESPAVGRAVPAAAGGRA